MVSTSQYLALATLLGATALGFSAWAQEGAAVPRAPMTYETDVRAMNPHAPTPQFAPLVPGVYSREVLSTAAPNGDYTVKILSLLISPKTSSNETSLPGATVLTLNAGRIEVVTGNSRSTLRPGGTLAVKEGALLRFVNPDGIRPAQLRAVVISGRR